MTDQNTAKNCLLHTKTFLDQVELSKQDGVKVDSLISTLLSDCAIGDPYLSQQLVAQIKSIIYCDDPQLFKQETIALLLLSITNLSSNILPYLFEDSEKESYFKITKMIPTNMQGSDHVIPKISTEKVQKEKPTSSFSLTIPGDDEMEPSEMLTLMNGGISVDRFNTILSALADAYIKNCRHHAPHEIGICLENSLKSNSYDEFQKIFSQRMLSPISALRAAFPDTTGQPDHFILICNRKAKSRLHLKDCYQTGSYTVSIISEPIPPGLSIETLNNLERKAMPEKEMFLFPCSYSLYVTPGFYLSYKFSVHRENENVVFTCEEVPQIPNVGNVLKIVIS